MAAFVVVAPNGPSSAPRSGARLNIFPGSATPAVFAAGSPFWIGYGFVPETREGAKATVHADTGFELLVDGEPVPLYTDVRTERGRTVRKFTVADFPQRPCARVAPLRRALVRRRRSRAHERQVDRVRGAVAR